MTALHDILAAFRNGDASIDELIAAFDAAAGEEPRQCRQLLLELTEQTRHGRFPPQVLSLLEARLSAPGPASAEPAGRPPGEVPPESAIAAPSHHAHPRPTQPPPAPIRIADGTGRASAGTADSPGGPAAAPPAPGQITLGAGKEPATVFQPLHPHWQRPPASDTGQPAEEDADTIPSMPAAGGEPMPASPTDTSAGATGTEASASSASGPSQSDTTAHEYPPLTSEPEVGTLLRSRFLLEEVMGRGGMGVVFKARDRAKEEVSFSKDEKNYVAIKLLNDRFKHNSASVKVLGREFANTQELNHPNVINLYDFDRDEYGNYFIAMELLPGEPLDRFIRRLRRSGGLPLEQALPIIEQMASALGAAHNHVPPIIHSDFKPGNVFITDSGHVTVFDFGIARAARPAGGDAEQTNFDPGSLGALTPAYASLEMLAGREPDKRDDIYALGIVSYELLTGQRPFGRKTTAQQAHEQGLQPPRVKGLSRRQWRGLRRALSLVRDKRTASVEQLLDDLRPHHSWVPGTVTVALGVIGVSGWFLVAAPWLDRRETAEIISAVGQDEAVTRLPELMARADRLTTASRDRVADVIVARLIALIYSADAPHSQKALAVTAALPTSMARRVYDGVAAELVEEINDAAPEQIVQRLPLLQGLPDRVQTEIKARAGAFIRGALLERSRQAFSPDNRAYDNARARSLLDQADALFPDSATVRDEMAELKNRYDDLLSDLDGQINTLRERGELLPRGDDRPSIPAILALLRGLDPTRFPQEYDYLANGYYNASKQVEDRDPALARTLVETGLGLFPGDEELSNQLARLGELEQLRAQQAMLAELRARIGEQIAGLGDTAPTESTLADLNALQRLAPDDPLLTQAGKVIRAGIEKRLPALIEARDWTGALAKIDAYGDLAGDQFVSSKTAAVREARQALQDRIDGVVATIERHLSDDDLGAADAALSELRQIDPGDTTLAQAQSEIVRAYLRLARDARADGDWDRARRLVDTGLARVTDTQLRLSFEDERAAIERGESAQRQAIAEAEHRRLEAERQQRIAEVRQAFGDFVSTMTATEDDARRARGFLDRLAGLAPDDPLLDTGPGEIAQPFIATAEAEAAEDRWLQALALLDTAQRLLPDVESLTGARARIGADYEQFREQRRLATIAAREAGVDTLLDRPEFDADWSGRLREALEMLQEAGGADLLPPLQARVDDLYRERLARLAAGNRFTEAQALLEQWARVTPASDQARASTAAELDAARVAWEQAEVARRLQAEIDAKKQSLLTRAEADQPQAALETLDALRATLGPNDSFVASEGPRLIAESYVRLARESRKRGVLDTALALLDKAQALASEVDTGPLRARIELDLEHEHLTVALAQADAAALAGLASRIDALRTGAPDDFADWSRQWATALARRVEQAPTPEDGQALLDAAQALFPESDELRRAQPPRPIQSPLIAEARTAIQEHRLSAAADIIERARHEVPDHPELDHLTSDLESNRAEAQRAFELYELAISRGQLSKANKAIELARQRWVDNPEWQQGESGQRIAPAPARSDDPCNPRFAGFGRSTRARCYDMIDADNRGPVMVVIPAGGGTSRPFAISRYETSVGDYNLYCRSTHECRPLGGSNKLPATGISRAQAEGYAAWLTRVSGRHYRLPTDGEWLFAAEARHRAPSGTKNCLIRSGGQIVKGGAPNLVSTGPQNSWGLVNFVGNVQEWTLDGGSLRARGGHFSDDAGSCDTSLTRAHSGNPDKTTGFRLVREIEG